MIEKQLAASHDDGRNVIEIMRDSARELPHYFHFLDVAQPLPIAQINLPPPFGLCMRSRSAVVRIEGPCFVFAQGRAACSGPFLLHVYQPPEVSRSVPFKIFSRSA